MSKQRTDQKEKESTPLQRAAANLKKTNARLQRAEKAEKQLAEAESRMGALEREVTRLKQAHRSESAPATAPPVAGRIAPSGEQRQPRTAEEIQAALAGADDPHERESLLHRLNAALSGDDAAFVAAIEECEDLEEIEQLLQHKGLSAVVRDKALDRYQDLNWPSPEA